MTTKEQNIIFASESENFEPYPYRDSEGVLTLGKGFNIDPKQISNPYPDFILEKWEPGQELTLNLADEWLNYLMDKHIIELKTVLPHFIDYPDYIQFVLTDMHYNLGNNRFLGFKLMLRAVEDRDYKGMIYEMMFKGDDSLDYSKWYNQVKDRARKLIRVVVKENIQEALNEKT